MNAISFALTCSFSVLYLYVFFKIYTANVLGSPASQLNVCLLFSEALQHVLN